MIRTFLCLTISLCMKGSQLNLLVRFTQDFATSYGNNLVVAVQSLTQRRYRSNETYMVCRKGLAKSEVGDLLHHHSRPESLKSTFKFFRLVFRQVLLYSLRNRLDKLFGLHEIEIRDKCFNFTNYFGFGRSIHSLYYDVKNCFLLWFLLLSAPSDRCQDMSYSRLCEHLPSHPTFSTISHCAFTTACSTEAKLRVSSQPEHLI